MKRTLCFLTYCRKRHYSVTGNLEVLLEVTSIWFYWLCYFSCRSSLDISPSPALDPFITLLLRCCAFGCHRYLSAVLCFSSPENTSSGLLQFQSEIEACCSSAICNCCIWDRCNASCDCMEATNPHSFYFFFATNHHVG